MCFKHTSKFNILFNFCQKMCTEKLSNIKGLMSSFSHGQNSHFASDLDLHLYLKELHFKILFTTYNKIHLSILSYFFTLLSYIYLSNILCQYQIICLLHIGSKVVGIFHEAS